MIYDTMQQKREVGRPTRLLQASKLKQHLDNDCTFIVSTDVLKLLKIYFLVMKGKRYNNNNNNTNTTTTTNNNIDNTNNFIQ